MEQKNCGHIVYKCDNCDHNVQFSIMAVENQVKHVSRERLNKKKKSQKKDLGVDLTVTQSGSSLEKLRHSIPGISQSLNFPVYVEIKHKGFWITDNQGQHLSTVNQQCDRNSVMLTNDCLLYVYKLALRHLLLSLKIINPSEIDAANLVPHIVVRKNKSDPFSKYNSIQSEKFLITSEMLTSKADFLLVELDVKRDLHTTLIYSKKINKRINLAEALKFVVSVLNLYPNLIQEYSNLPDFGLTSIKYWFDIPQSYPFQISCPSDYQPLVKKKLDLQSHQLSPAGSVLEKL